MAVSAQAAVQETVKISISTKLIFFMGKCNIFGERLAQHKLMYNQATQYLLDIYRKYFGFVAVRERVKGRKDAFFQLHSSDDSQADQQTLRRLSKSVTKLSDICFKECVSMQYKLFTSDQSACISSCVESYFRGYQQITRYTHYQLNA